MESRKITLFGGLLYQLGCRSGLIRKKTDSKALGLALGFFLWGILIVLAILNGSSSKIFSLKVIDIHVRLLLAIPLFFITETLVFPQIEKFVRSLVRMKIVPDYNISTLNSCIHKLIYLKNAWFTDVFLLLSAYAFSFLSYSFEISSKTENWYVLMASTSGQQSWNRSWYIWVCLPVFRFLLFRWVLYLTLWWYFLIRLQKLDLQLIPTHPDRSGGLGYIGIVQENFSPLIFALSSVVSANLAVNIYGGSLPHETVYHLSIFILVLTALLFIGPLFFFILKLRTCRTNGLLNYTGFAFEYVKSFESKWINDRDEERKSILGTSDIQALADLANSFNIIRSMQFIPADKRNLIIIIAAVVLPLLPLLLFKYHFEHLALDVLRMIIGF
jgi:hypothetical protein